MTKNLSFAEFQEKVHNFEKNQGNWNFEGDKPCIIDFYADWCGPCKMLSPILEEISNEYEGKIDVYKVDTEAEQELSGAFGIRSIPSILFVPMEGKPTMSAGLMDKANLRSAISNVLEVAAQ